MERVYDVTIHGSFSIDTQVTARSREEAYELAIDMVDELNLTTDHAVEPLDCSIEASAFDVEEVDLDYEEDYEV